MNIDDAELPALQEMALVGAGSVTSPTADTITVLFGGPLRRIDLATQEAELRAKLVHLAKMMPGIEASTFMVLCAADAAEGSRRIDRLAEGYARLLEGREIVDGRWTEPLLFTTRSMEDLREALDRLAREARAGAVATDDLAKRLDDWKSKAADLEPPARAPNRHERRRQAALDRRRR